MPTDYIIEIQIKKWNPKDPRNDDGCGSVINLHPVHEDEEANCYFRRQASLVKVNDNSEVEIFSCHIYF